MTRLLHILEEEWEKNARARYRSAYPVIAELFRERLQHAFLRERWIPDPLSLRYLTRLLIRFLPAPLNREMLEMALEMREMALDDPSSCVRLYENAGEMILWYSGLYRQPILQEQGRSSYEIAYRWLEELEKNRRPQLVLTREPEPPGSDRLRMDRMLSQQFEHYREVLTQSDLIEDRKFLELRDVFLDDDFSVN